MRVFVPLLIENARLVEEIDADLSRSVDDSVVSHDDAHMADGAAVFAEKGQVARLCFLKEIHQLAAFHLL